MGKQLNGGKERPTGIGGTDAIRIVEGKWKELWLEKIGETQRADLSDILPVQLGIFTEKFNRQWYQKVTGERVVSLDKIWKHPQIDFIYGSLDGITNGKVWEGKHTNPFGSEGKILDKYYPQLQHYMLVTGLSEAILSVIIGNMNYKIFKVKKDEEFIQHLLKAETLFWNFVTTRMVPPDFMEFNKLKEIKDAKDIVELFGIEISEETWLQRTLN